MSDQKVSIYEKCPVLENESFKIRLIEESDADDLWSVYSDKFALPFFNSDNCHGTNFYCEKKEYVTESIKYWLMEYHETKGFVRFSIIDKKSNKAIGTIEMFKREAEDYFDQCGLLRLDLRSDYEETKIIHSILSLVTEPFYSWFECEKIATKAAVYAVDRIEALKESGFIKSDEPLVGTQNMIKYYDYWIIEE